MVSGLWAMVAAVNRSHQRVMCRFPMSISYGKRTVGDGSSS